MAFLFISDLPYDESPPRWAPQSFDFMYFIRLQVPSFFFFFPRFFVLLFADWTCVIQGWNPTMAGWTFNRRQNGPFYPELHRISLYTLSNMMALAVSATIVCSLFFFFLFSSGLVFVVPSTFSSRSLYTHNCFVTTIKRFKDSLMCSPRFIFTFLWPTSFF